MEPSFLSKLLVLGTVAAIVLLLVAIYFVLEPEWRNRNLRETPQIGRVIAVLGDSDSHSYRDSESNSKRGGEFHHVAFQWTEIWNSLRADEVNLGPVGVWGTRVKVARLRRMIGLESRPFKKNDFRYNYSASGARCSSLYDRYPFQATSLLDLMNLESGAFDDALVIIRIGINDFGQTEHLQAWSEDGMQGLGKVKVDYCIDQIQKAVSDILATSATVMIALVDVSHDYNSSSFSADLFSKGDVENFLSVLNHFEQGLKGIATDSRVAYVDDVSSQRAHWGDRYRGNFRRESFLGGINPIVNGNGDEPFHRTLMDGHASTINNGIWLQYAIHSLNGQLGVGLTSLLDAEIASIADPDGTFGLAPEHQFTADGDIELTGLPASVDVQSGSDQYPLPRLTAKSSDGLNVTNTITGYLVDAAGKKDWLYGSGSRLYVNASRHKPGEYQVVIRARDRYGNVRRWDARLTIS